MLVLLIFLSLSTPAYAYLDPNTGSLILQGLIAVAAGALVFSKRIYYGIKSLFNKGKHNDDEDN